MQLKRPSIRRIGSGHVCAARAIAITSSLLLLASCGGGSGSSAPSTYDLSAKVSGLHSTGLVLSVDNSQVSVGSGATTVSLASGLSANTAYTVTVATQPSGENCAISNGSGTITDANVTDVQISCQQLYSLSASFTHLHDSGLTLLVNGSKVSVTTGTTSLVLASNLISGTNYSVSITGQPSNQTCSIKNGSGTISGANVSNVTINCPFTVLYDFSFTPGQTTSQQAWGSLILGADGNLYGMGGAQGVNMGDLFEYNLTAHAESIIWEFTGPPNGFAPMGTLVQTSQGNFEGIAQSGGQYNAGTIFQYNPINNTEADLMSFDSASTGGTPVGGIGDYNNVSGASCAGLVAKPVLGLAEIGAGGSINGEIYALSSTNAVTVRYVFGGQPDGSQPVGRLVFDCTTGMFYGLTHTGGTAGYGSLFQFDPAGNIETVLYSFQNGADGAYPDGSLIVATDGNLYGMTSAGGIYGDGGIFQYNVPTGAMGVLYSFSGGTTDGSKPEGSLLEASDGNLYGTTTEGGKNNEGTIFEFDAATDTDVVLHSFMEAGYIGGPQGHLIDDGNGDLYGLTDASTLDSVLFEYQIH